MSIVDYLGIEQFGFLLLAVTFLLSISPYLSGVDFGLAKIPELTPARQARLKLIGPILFIGALGLHIPFISDGNGATDPINPVETPVSSSTTVNPAVGSDLFDENSSAVVATGCDTSSSQNNGVVNRDINIQYDGLMGIYQVRNNDGAPLDQEPVCLLFEVEDPNWNRVLVTMRADSEGKVFFAPTNPPESVGSVTIWIRSDTLDGADEDVVRTMSWPPGG